MRPGGMTVSPQGTSMPLHPARRTYSENRGRYVGGGINVGLTALTTAELAAGATATQEHNRELPPLPQ